MSRGISLERFTRIADFYHATESFLVANEAENNLLLGITSSVMEDGWPDEQPIYAGVVRDAGEIVAVALRTPPYNVLVSAAPDHALRSLVADIHALYRTVPGVIGPREASRMFAEEWQRRTGDSFHIDVAERIYQLDRVVPVVDVPGRLRPVFDGDRALIEDWMFAFAVEARGQSDRDSAKRAAAAYLTASTRKLYLWDDGQPVSMAGWAGPTPNGVRVTAVYTPPERRGHGYASACVAALSQHLLDNGRRLCFLFTDLSNPTSNSIYQRICYRPIVDVDEYLFVTGAPTTGESSADWSTITHE